MPKTISLRIASHPTSCIDSDGLDCRQAKRMDGVLTCGVFNQGTPLHNNQRWAACLVAEPRKSKGYKPGGKLPRFRELGGKLIPCPDGAWVLFGDIPWVKLCGATIPDYVAASFKERAK